MSSRPKKTDYDGRSAVSSFYGAPAASNESGPYGGRAQPATGRRDSQSTFFGRNGEDYNPQQLQYESEPLRDHPGDFGGQSYPHRPYAIEPVKGGADEEPGQGAGWDVYADFNNAGPRYSNVPFAAAIKGNDG